MGFLQNGKQKYAFDTFYIIARWPCFYRRNTIRKKVVKTGKLKIIGCSSTYNKNYICPYIPKKKNLVARKEIETRNIFLAMILFSKICRNRL